MFHSAIRSARRFFERGKVFLQDKVRRPLSRAELAGPMTDDFVQSDQEILAWCRTFWRSISAGSEANFGMIFEPRSSSIARLLPTKRKFLVPYFSWISFSLGRLSPIVLTLKIAGFDQCLNGLDDRGLETTVRLYFASQGAFVRSRRRSAQACVMAVVTGLSVMVTKLCELPFAPRASR